MTDTKPEALRKCWILDAQWSDLSKEAKEEVSNLWRMMELGNDHYVHQTTINELRDLSERDDVKTEVFLWGEEKNEQKGWVEVPFTCNHLLAYLEQRLDNHDEDIWIHYWW